MIRTLVRAIPLAHIFLFCSMLHAQTDPLPPPDTTEEVKAVVFSGTSRADGQYSNRQGSEQEIPDAYGRWELSPAIDLYNVPLSMFLMISSEESPQRQRISGFNISYKFNTPRLRQLLRQRLFRLNSNAEVEPKMQQLREIDSAESRLRDPGTLAQIERLAELESSGAADTLLSSEVEKLREIKREYDAIEATIGELRETRKTLDDVAKLKTLAEDLSRDSTLDPATVKSTLSSFGVLSGMEKFFYTFSKLSAGVTYPEYSALTLSGVPVTGLDVEFTPGGFLVAASVGRTQAEIQATDTTRIRFKRSIYAGKLGYGRKGEGHFHLGGMYAIDDDNSVQADSSGVRTPMANYILAADASVAIVPRYFSVEGEVSGSIVTGDTRSARIENSDIPQAAGELVEPRISSFLDYAYTARSLLTIPEWSTRVSASMRMIGPGYYSLGVPTLRNDNMKFEIKGDQRFLQRQITLASYYRRDRDNLIGNKASTTTLTSYGVNLSAAFRGLPYLRLSYTPYIQQSDNSIDSQRIDTRVSLFSASAGYSYSIADVRNLTTFSFMTQETRTLQGDFDYGSNSYIAGQYVTFTFPLSLSATLNLIQPTIGRNISGITTSFDFSGTYTAFEVWQNSASISLATDGNNNTSVGFALATAFPLWVFGTMNIQLNRTTYREELDPSRDFNDIVLRATLTSRW